MAPCVRSVVPNRMSDSENSDAYLENEDFDATLGRSVVSPFGGLNGQVFKTPQHFLSHSASVLGFDFSRVGQDLGESTWHAPRICRYAL